jgi:hypothetical protein
MADSTRDTPAKTSVSCHDIFAPPHRKRSRRRRALAREELLHPPRADLLSTLTDDLAGCAVAKSAAARGAALDRRQPSRTSVTGPLPRPR